MRTALCLALVACGSSAEPEPPVAPEQPAAETRSAATPTGTWQPTEAEERAIKALSVREPEPRCADVEGMVEEPVSTWRNIIAHVETPPWVPMRAATCLLAEHPREAEADALAWVADPEAAGLTTLVIGRLDGLPLDSAKRIGEAALAGPHAEIARRRLEKLRTPELRNLANP